MKSIKYIILGIVLSFVAASSGVDAASYIELSVLDISVPGAYGIATVSGEERHVGGYQYALTTSAIDKVTSGSRAVSARTYAMYDNDGYSAWTNIPAGSGYKNLGNLDTNAYKLQLKENTWSALGFYWNGKWKLSR